MPTERILPEGTRITAHFAWQVLQENDHKEGRGGGTAPVRKGAACRQIGLMAIHFSHFQDPFPDVDLLLDYKIFKLLDPKVIASQGCVTLWASS